MSSLSLHNIEDADVPGDKKKSDAAAPGIPAYHFYAAK